MCADALYRGIKKQNYLDSEWVEGYLAKGIFGERHTERPDSHWCIIRKEEITTDHDNEYCLRSYEICQYTICKFTGYVDINKNKIWEDSIVKITCSDSEFALHVSLERGLMKIKMLQLRLQKYVKKQVLAQ